MKKQDVTGMMAKNKPFDTQSNTALSPGHAVAAAPQPTSLLGPEAGSGAPHLRVSPPSPHTHTQAFIFVTAKSTTLLIRI